ncbi:MAG: hypothetical protein WC935_03650, partial [Thermoleophilia bacterium]
FGVYLDSGAGVLSSLDRCQAGHGGSTRYACHHPPATVIGFIKKPNRRIVALEKVAFRKG